VATTSTSNGPVAPAVGNDAIEILMNDHVAAKGLLADLVGATEPAKRTAILQKLKAALTIHNATEENLVYPAVRDVAKRPHESEKLYHQQDEAKVVIWELDMLSEDPDEFEERAAKLQAAVEAHIRKEEETEYPHLREALGRDGLDKLTAAVREFRDSFQYRMPTGK